MMATSTASPLAQPSIIDCCDSVFKMNESTEEQQINLQLRSFEEKFERSLQEMKNKYDRKCEQYDQTIAEISKELFETKQMLNDRHSKLHTVVDAKMVDQNVSITSSATDGNDDLPLSLQFDKDRLRKNQNNSDSDSNTAEHGICSVVVHRSDRSHDHSSSFEDTTSTPASIEGLIRKELRSYMKEVLAERETQTYLLQREVDKQNQQIAQLRIDVLSRLRVLDFQVVKPRQPDQPIPLHCMKFEGTEVEIELIEEGKLTCNQSSLSVITPKSERQTTVVQAEDPLSHFTSQICNKLIMDNAEHLMKTWGTQFDDLTIYLQDNLDKQRECIADVRKSTFEHIDAETQTRVGVLNEHLNFIGRKNQQQEKAIQELHDEQERSFLVVVETLIKLKSKFQGVGDQVKQQEETHLSAKGDLEKLRQKLIDESNSWTLRFNQQDGKLQQLKDKVDQGLKEMEDVIEDRDSIQTILSATIELFNAKMESSNTLMSDQLITLENRLNTQIEAGQAEIQKMTTHRREMEIVVTAICKKLVDLTADVSVKQRTEVEQLLIKTEEGQCVDKQVQNDIDHFKYIKVNQKKYKKALWFASKQRSGNKLFEQDTMKKEIEFYDLTFTESKSND